ncbi:hypothetical protein SeLEV6574_g08393, partial [Synchytrium endobioticum]
MSSKFNIRDLVNRANLHPDTQTNTFLESLNPWVLRAWKPVTMPDTYDELVSSIRIALQIDDTIKQAEKNAKNRNSTNYGTSSRYGTSNISNSGYSKNSASKQVDAPSINSSRPGPFLVNPEKPLYKLRVDRGLCTRCGMKGHDADKCVAYPKSRSNGQNFEAWQRRMGRGKVVIAAVKERADAADEMGDQLYEVCETYSNDNIASKEQAYSLRINNVSSRKYPPYFLLNFVLNPTSGRLIVRGQALVDSGATRSFIGQ